MLHFLLITFVLVATPRLELLYVVGRAVAHGPRAAVLAAWGMALAMCLHIILALFGLGFLMLFGWLGLYKIKLVGAACLCLSGFWMLSASRLSGQRGWGRETLFSRTLMVLGATGCNVLNSKASWDFLRWNASLHLNGSAWAWLALALSGVVAAALAFLWFCLVGLVTASLSEALRQRPGFSLYADQGAGVLLLLLAVALALQAA